MKLFGLRVTLLVEDEDEAQRATDRIMLALRDHGNVVDIGELENITHTASTEADLPAAEIEAQRTARAPFFRNHMHRINQTLV